MSPALAAVDYPAPLSLTGTRLSALLAGDLCFHGEKDAFPPHGWHPFPAKFPPQLPRLFINELTEAGDCVLDPMAGSGTTLLEAARLDRRAIGCDIDPLAIRIAEAKLSSVQFGRIVEVGYQIVESGKARLASARPKVAAELDARFDEATRAFVDYWFSREIQLELSALLGEIEKIRTAKIRQFFEMVFSSVIIAKSGGVSLARDLAHTRPHKAPGKNPISAFGMFVKRIGRIVRGGEADFRRDFKLRQASAKNTGFPAGSVDLVVTSPPYANNAIDYMRAHKFALVWFGHKIGELSRLRSKYLGHDAVNGGEARAVILPSQCEKILRDLSEVDAKKSAALGRYFSEMSEVIVEMRRVLKVNRAAIVIVGTSILRGVDVETQKCLAAIGEAAGFELAGIGVRQLDRDRRMMPARWDKGSHTRIEQRMHDEHIIGLAKVK